jgi:hypothetical protein
MPGWATTAQPSHKIEFGHIDTLSSKVLGEKRALWIYVPPAGPDDSYYAPKRYPVLYLLDPDASYFYTSSLVQQLSLGESMGMAACPAMIVVGIVNTNRSRDLTPTHSLKGIGPYQDRSLVRSGGGGRFMEFLEQELLPYVDAHYPTLPYRVFAGHSFGGLTVLNALATKPSLFTTYVAIEPSLWWDNAALLQQIKTTDLPRAAYQGKKLFVAVANTLPAGRDTVHLQADTLRSTLPMRANLGLIKWLRQQKSTLAWQWKYYPDENHFSVALPAQYDALRSLFRHQELVLPASVADPAYAVATMQRYYTALSQQFGYTVVPPEELVNLCGWSCLQNKAWEKAYGFFQLNAKNFPQSFNANSSLGEYYKQHGEQAKALHYYSQALRIQDTPEVRQVVSELSAKH